MSEAIQKVMLDYVIPNLTQAEIEELKAELAKFSSSAAPPKPREWRLWDMVRNGDVAWIRTRPNYWVSMRDGSTTVDQDMNLKDDIYLANLADLLAQGDMLVGLTEDEAKHIETVCFNCSGCAAMWHKVRAALAAREGKK